MIVSQCPQPPNHGVSRRIEWIRIVRVRVQECVRGGHAPDPGHRRDAAGRGARRSHATTDLRVECRAVNRVERRVEQLRHVRQRRGRAQPPALVRLVPDEPQLHPGIALRSGGGKRRERGARPRRPVRRSAAVRPARRPVERDDGRDPTVVQALEDRVHVSPTPLPAHLLDLVPVDREANEVDADPVELVDPLVERPRPVDEPRVVLKAVPDERRRVGGLSEAQQRCDGAGENEDPAHRDNGSRGP